MKKPSWFQFPLLLLASLFVARVLYIIAIEDPQSLVPKFRIERRDHWSAWKKASLVLSTGVGSCVFLFGTICFACLRYPSKQQVH